MNIIEYAKEGNLEKIREEINNGINLNIDDHGHKALIEASKGGHTEVVKEITYHILRDKLVPKESLNKFNYFDLTHEEMQELSKFYWDAKENENEKIDNYNIDEDIFKEINILYYSWETEGLNDEDLHRLACLLNKGLSEVLLIIKNRGCDQRE